MSVCKKLSPEQLTEILDAHAAWLADPENGKRAGLPGADLSWATVTGADLTRADLTGVDLSWADLTGATMTGATMTGATMTGADLTGAAMTGADLTGADLTGADLTGADLTGVDLSWATMTGADLTGADLTGATMTRVDLTGADLMGTNRKDAVFRLALGRYTVAYVKPELRIGCQRHTVEEWEAFTDEEIARMDDHALEFWKAHKARILNLCKSYE